MARLVRIRRPCGECSATSLFWRPPPPPYSNRDKIHISKAQSPEEDPKLSSKAARLMHRLTVDEVMAKMDAVEK